MVSLMMKTFLFLFGLAITRVSNEQNDALSDRYICRLRFHNISAAGGRKVRNQKYYYNPLFTARGNVSAGTCTTWLGTDVGEDPNVAEVTFEMEKYVESTFSKLQYAYVGVEPDQASLRCSKLFNNSRHWIDRCDPDDNKQFIDSYEFTMGEAKDLYYAIRGPYILQNVALNPQSELDCYLKNGYVHPYTQQHMDRYLANGEGYKTGCSVIGTCQNYSISSIPICTQQVFQPSHVPVRKVGECCEIGLEKAAVEAKGCPKEENGLAFRFPTGAQISGGYQPVIIPWQVRFGKMSDNLVCDGVIISKRWFLTTKSCLNDRDGLVFHRPHSINSTEKFPKNVTIVEVKKLIDTDPSLDLILVKLSMPFVTDDWSTAIQAVNLPWNQAICQKFLESDCHILLGTEERNVSIDSNVLIATSTGGSAGNQSYIQSIEKRDPSPILLGSGAVSWYGKVNFLVGIYIGAADMKVNGDTIRLMGAWNDSGRVGKVISICPLIDAIGQVRD